MSIPSEPDFTDKQGQYLAFIYLYTKLNKQPPAEADIQRYFGVTPPSVHTMILTLEKRGLIRRQPGRARTLEAARDSHLLPRLDALFELRDKWSVDDFGPITLARYAAAESFFVFLDEDPERWKCVAGFFDSVRRLRDPTDMPPASRLDELAKGWAEFVGAK